MVFLCALPTASHTMATKIGLTSSGAVKAAGSNLDEQAQHPAFPAQTRKWLRVDDKGKSTLVKVTEKARQIAADVFHGTLSLVDIVVLSP